MTDVKYIGGNPVYDVTARAAIAEKADADDVDALDTRVTVVESDIAELQDGGYVADQQKISEKINDWLEEHPEATTTVQDRSLTYAKLVPGTLGFVTPEMYGAKGDGVTDDTQAIQSAIDSGKSVLFNKKTYVCGRVNISGNNVIIDGNFATVLHGANSGFVILEGTHDVVICNFHSVCTYEKDSSQETNAHIIVGSNSTSPDEEYFAYNITVQNCSFNGGVMGVAVTSAKNVLIDNCKFDGFVYKPEYLAGGYGILIQSCIDVSIANSEFSVGAYGRHDVYISVDQRKSVHVKNKNVTIDRCKFNHSALVLDENNYYYSPNTVPVNVRATERITISNSYFHSVTGAVNLFSPDGPIDGAVVENCLIDSPVYNSGAGEVRHIIGISGTAENHIKADISGITVLNVPAAYMMFAAIRNCTVNIYSCNIGATDIVCYENCTPHVFDIITAITSNFMRFNGVGETKGFCRNITFLNGLSGNKYYFGVGSTVSNDFYDTIQIRVKLPISAGWTDWIALPNGMNPEKCYCSGIGMLNSTGIRYGQGTYTESVRIYAELSANGMRVYNSDQNYFDSYAYVCITPVPRLYI